MPHLSARPWIQNWESHNESKKNLCDSPKKVNKSVKHNISFIAFCNHLTETLFTNLRSKIFKIYKTDLSILKREKYQNSRRSLWGGLAVYEWFAEPISNVSLKRMLEVNMFSTRFVVYKNHNCFQISRQWKRNTLKTKL